MDLNQNRNEFRNRFRIAPLAPEVPESPLSFSRGVDEALVRLLTTVSTRAGSVEAIRSNFRELKAQNVALVAAMRAAFEEFLSRVDPKELEERFERATKRGVFGAQNKSRYWDLYTELFAGLVQRPPTASRICSSRPSQKPTKPRCECWCRRGEAASARTERSLANRPLKRSAISKMSRRSRLPPCGS
jgi:hypothetical protein